VLIRKLKDQGKAVGFCKKEVLCPGDRGFTLHESGKDLLRDQMIKDFFVKNGCTFRIIKDLRHSGCFFGGCEDGVLIGVIGRAPVKAAELAKQDAGIHDSIQRSDAGNVAGI
jgi:hypothetical protein